MIRPGRRRLLVALLLTLAPFTNAAGACLSGPGATGISTGPDTVSATAKNVTPSIVLSGEHCGPQHLATSREAGGSGGNAAFTANNFGIAAATSAASGGAPAGSATATAAPQLSVAFRVETLPGYAGGGTADIRLQALLSVAGDGNASGLGSAVGGSFETTVAMGALNEQNVAFAWTGNGSLLSTTTRTVDEDFTIDLDRDYELFFSHDQFVIATNGQSAEGMFGSAVVAGTSKLTYQVDLLSLDPFLALTFPMVAALGLEPSYLGADIDPGLIPIPAGLPLLLAPLVLLLASSRRTRQETV